jgi:hypothetical protein
MGYSRKKKHAKGGGRTCTGSSNNNGNRRQRGRGATSSAIHVSVVNNAATPDLPIRPLEINQETRWKPRSLASNIKEAESSETHDSRLVLQLLNKLTPQNFKKLVSSGLCVAMHDSRVQ